MVAHGLRIFNYCLPDGRDEEKREGGRDRRGGGGGGGACEQHIYICISTLHLVIRGKNPLPLEALHVLPIFPLHKHYKGDATHLFSLMGIWICQDSSRIVGSCSELVWIQTTVRLRMLDFRMWMCSEMLHGLCDARPTGLTRRETLLIWHFIQTRSEDWSLKSKCSVIFNNTPL